MTPPERIRIRIHDRLPRLKWSRRSVRVRAMTAAVLVVGLALATGGVVMVALLRDSLAASVLDGARSRAEIIATTLLSGRLPDELPVNDENEELVQIYDPTGTVLVASRNVIGIPPLVPPGRSPTDTPIRDPVGDSELAVATTTTLTPRGPLTVLVGRSLISVSESTGTVTRELAIGLPVLLGVVAVTSWLLVGWSLAPVEATRREVDEISSAALHRRVGEPAGHDVFARLSRTMNRMLARLEQAQRRQRRLVADASHELRSPVAALRQHAEVALRHPDRSGVRRLAETVLAESARLQRLIDDLLLLARADEHALRLGGAPIDLDDLVFDEAERLRRLSALRVDTTAVSAGRVDGDAMGLQRVLFNLGENACRHAKHGIWFAMSYQRGHIVLTVDDDGDGIAEQDRDRVLERFVRLDEARARDSGGAGLGLAIVRDLTVAHGGTVTITDSPHGGARVSLSFPASTDPADQPRPTSSTEPGP